MSISTWCLGTNSSIATPKASSIEEATGSIKKFCGRMGRIFTTVRDLTFTPTACMAPSRMGCVAGVKSCTSSRTSSAMPVPNTAAFNKHSATALRVLVYLNSSSRALRKKVMSSRSPSRMSSWMSNHLPRPKVASSTSATLLSTACCKAGLISLLRSLSRVRSAASH